ncbi:MAG TPA: excinuclease ABC subunit UvrC [Candidatus Hydrogenedentes bacterium]|nr:excinuclease ABC subunit UvrC [Candidatus Hydrogenedentota bacterium]HOL76209.1 excinuclease ABC subunit UvrC [Candidatus Hydrogenedentota bacterium]HPO86495.1 excinuclease ABC subunit UvrC [Candidatus Hydrogenedentota bacterium]
MWYLKSMVTSEEHSDKGFPEHGIAHELQSLDLATVPTEPGCYIMRDAQGVPVYVGKAANLRARIRTYLANRDERATVAFLMQRAVHIEFIVTRNEKEALLLEDSLIKRYRPRYNIRLRDDKTYVSVRVNLSNEFPRITVTRKIVRDGSRYFGPYASALAVRETLKQMQRVFPLRTCSDAVLRNRTRPCLYYEIGQCTAPCVGKITPEAYREIVNQAVMALEGKRNDVEALLLEKIRAHAERLEFEQAAVIRDRLLALRQTFEQQYAVRTDTAEDRDVFGVHREGRFCVVQVLFFRSGRIIGSRAFPFSRLDMPLDEMFSSFLLQFYTQGVPIPDEILLPMTLEDTAVLEDFLSEQRGKRVAIRHPQRGEKRAFLDLAERNAKSSFEEMRLREHAQRDVLEQARQLLELPQIPERMECFDISTIQGDKPVGAMSVFVGGVPDKTRYRHYAIREVKGQDDFAMLHEVVLRRMKRAIAEGDLPDLVVIDGGKGQLNAALAALRDLGIEDLPIVSIAKARPEENRPDATQDRFFLPGRKNPVVPPPNSPVLHLFMRLRDEAHRFAISYHRKRRGKTTLKTILDDIPGLGKKRVQALLNAFGSVERIRAADVSEVAALPGFGVRTAQQIKNFLNERIQESTQPGDTR